MSIRKVNFVNGEYYHIYNRGNSKQVIFRDEEDYKRFIGLMYACNQKENFKSDNLKKDQGLFNVERTTRLVEIGAYCLMSNHFHILITQTEFGDISNFMKKLTTGYVMYFNKKYKRTGGLFEGKFKSEHADTDNYLRYLFSYIHLNPVKLIQKDWKEKGIKDKSKVLDFLKNYNYSSYQEYLGVNRVENKVLDIENFPKYFHNKDSFTKEIFEWLSYNSPLGKT